MFLQKKAHNTKRVITHPRKAQPITKDPVIICKKTKKVTEVKDAIEENKIDESKNNVDEVPATKTRKSKS